MTRKTKISKSNRAQEAMAEDNGTGKAKVKDFLEAVRKQHLQAAEGLTNLLSQIDRASPYLLERYAREVDWDPACEEGWEQASDAAEYFVPIRVWYYDILDEFLNVEAQQLPLRLRQAREDAARHRPQRDRDRAEVEAA